MRDATLPLSVLVLSVTSCRVLIQSLLNTFLSVPYNNPFVLKLSTVKALGCEFTACPTVGSSRSFFYLSSSALLSFITKASLPIHLNVSTLAIIGL